MDTLTEKPDCTRQLTPNGQINAADIAFFVLLALNSQALFVNVHNPVGIPYLQELFQLFLLSYVVLIRIPWAILHNRMHWLDFMVLALVVVAWLGSAWHALLRYHQPLVYGLLEDRRILGLLVYFPLVDIMRNRPIRPARILNFVMLIAIGCIGYGLLVKFGIGPTVRVLEVNAENVRSGRLSIGLYYIAFAYVISLVRMSKAGDWKWGVGSAIFFFALLLLGESRQIIIAATLVSLVIFWMYFRRLYRFLLAAIAAVGGLILLFFEQFKEVMHKYYDLFVQLFSAEYLAESARIKTIGTIFHELQNSYFLGHGALSLRWRGGFHRLYGENFFLADVGSIGTLFRYGLLAVPLLLALVLLVSKTIGKLPPGGYRKTLACAFLFSVILIPTAGLLVYRSYFVGLILALAHFSQLENMAPEQMSGFKQQMKV